MYSRAPRFRKLITATPENIGPATYLLTDIFDQNISCQCGAGGQNPFNSSSLRTISFSNKNLIKNPSPNKYKICFRKQRIVGGTTIQNKAPRFTYKEKDYIIGPDLTREANIVPGHIHRGVPPRNSVTKVTTIPEKGAEGYLESEDGLVKIYNPPEDRPIGPTTYYNPEEDGNSSTLQYKGNFWSLRRATRFNYKTADGPSPADYSIDAKHDSLWKKYQDLLRCRNQANAPSLRYDDILLRKLFRENLPGPGAYSQHNPNLKKCECGKGGTFSKSKRECVHKTSEGPGPADYSDPRTALEKPTRTAQSPFNVKAQRFSDPQLDSLPGPADYTPEIGLWNEVKKKEHSRYSQFSAPFDSSSYRNTTITKSDVLCIPGPDMYYPQFQRKGDHNKSSMFASAVKRGFSNKNQNLPGPNTYPATESFKLVSSRRSHLQAKDSAFLTSSVRMKPLGRSYSPGPDTYDTIQSSLNSKSGVIGMKFGYKAAEKTPGPAHYKIHPKYETSRVLYTSNVTLRPQSKPKGNKKKKEGNEVVRELRRFSSKPYPTRHCAID